MVSLVCFRVTPKLRFGKFLGGWLPRGLEVERLQSAAGTGWAPRKDCYDPARASRAEVIQWQVAEPVRTLEAFLTVIWVSGNTYQVVSQQRLLQ